MPVGRIAVLAGIAAFFFSVLAVSYRYGPSQRSFASPPKVVTVASSEQIVRTWESSGVKGRIAVCFTRYLNAHETKESTELKATELSLDHGILRKVMHVTPDSAWPEIHGALSKRNDMRPTTEGFIGIFDAGRVYIQPFSRFSELAEKALIIIEPKVWSGTELQQIAEKLKSGRISSDLLVIIRGTDKDADLFRHAISLNSSASPGARL